MGVHYILIFSAIKLIINRIKVKIIFNKFYKPSGSRICYGVAEWFSRIKGINLENKISKSCVDISSLAC